MNDTEQQNEFIQDDADKAAAAAAIAERIGEDDTGQPGNEQQQQTVTPEQSLAGFLKVASLALGIAGLKNTAAVWNEGNCDQLAQVAVPVMMKYAWGQKVIAMLTKGAGVEEMAFFAVAAPMAFATMQAYRMDTQPQPPAEKEVNGEQASS